MIEIPPGWTAAQTTLARDICRHTLELEQSLEATKHLHDALKKLKASCKHERVEADCDELWCTICNEMIGQ